uniref:Protein TAPT1 homolog n=1 Tax=Parascaris univalens TaxID=6257 RepID=A0A915BBS3_PARUN
MSLYLMKKIVAIYAMVIKHLSAYGDLFGKSLQVCRCYSLQNDVTRYTEKRRKVYAFIRIPIELEKFLLFGFMQCVEAFCHLTTFLPIRLFMCIFGWLLRIRKWTTADTCDFLKAAVVVVASFLMQIVDTSVIYHQVRGQGVIKLYIFYNMLEVADKLFSSFGQDTLDVLFWTATERVSNPFRTLMHFVAAVAYALLHTLLVLLQATTLNVAFNSHNQALLAIMMSNNFVELKGSVFKKFAKPNLFQMSCSDVRERFHIMVLLSVVVVRNMMAVSWKIDHLIEMLPDLMMVVIAELMVDWLKHAFITKFNEIPAEVYRDFKITIAYDVVQSRDEDAFSDYSDQVSRRMGFIPIPLTIMLIRVLTQSLTLTTKPALLLFGMAWFLLLTVKILNGIVMLGKACEYVIAYRNLQAKAEYEIYRKRLLMKKSKSVPSSPRMSLIDFSDVLHQTAATKGGFTVSDLMSHWDELCRSAELAPVPETTTPRRTQSLASFSRQRRDNSLPPPAIPECEEREEMQEVNDATKATPKRRQRPNECDESLSGVQAYTMLNNAPESVGEIQS